MLSIMKDYQQSEECRYYTSTNAKWRTPFTMDIKTKNENILEFLIPAKVFVDYDYVSIPLW